MAPVDMSPEAITRRLRQVAELSKHPQIDMSAEAVTHRLREVSQLRALCLKLEQIGRDNGLGDARKR